MYQPSTSLVHIYDLITGNIRKVISDVQVDSRFQVVIDIQKDIPLIVEVAPCLDRVLFHLISNAVRFGISEGLLLVHVSYEIFEMVNTAPAASTTAGTAPVSSSGLVENDLSSMHVTFRISNIVDKQMDSSVVKRSVYRVMFLL